MAFNNQRRQKSYFEQQRNQSNDPNFYNGLSDEDLRRQVKRIVRDIRNGNILEQDMIYFKNQRIIGACVAESFERSRESKIIADACRYYNDNALAQQQYAASAYNSDIMAQRNYCTNAFNNASIKGTIWYECWVMFDAIAKGYDIPYMLNHISGIDISLFKYL